MDPSSGELPRLFDFSKNLEITEIGLEIQVRVISGKKRPLPGSLHTVVRFCVKKTIFSKVEFG